MGTLRPKWSRGLVTTAAALSETLQQPPCFMSFLGLNPKLKESTTRPPPYCADEACLRLDFFRDSSGTKVDGCGSYVEPSFGSVKNQRPSLEPTLQPAGRCVWQRPAEKAANTPSLWPSFSCCCEGCMMLSGARNRQTEFCSEVSCGFLSTLLSWRPSARRTS